MANPIRGCVKRGRVFRGGPPEIMARERRLHHSILMGGEKDIRHSRTLSVVTSLTPAQAPDMTWKWRRPASTTRGALTEPWQPDAIWLPGPSKEERLNTSIGRGRPLCPEWRTHWACSKLRAGFPGPKHQKAKNHRGHKHRYSHRNSTERGKRKVFLYM